MLENRNSHYLASYIKILQILILLYYILSKFKQFILILSVLMTIFWSSNPLFPQLRPNHSRLIAVGRWRWGQRRWQSRWRHEVPSQRGWMGMNGWGHPCPNVLGVVPHTTMVGPPQWSSAVRCCCISLARIASPERGPSKLCCCRPNGKCLHLHQSKPWHLTLKSLMQSLSSIQFPETMLPRPCPFFQAFQWVVVLLLNFNYKCNN